MAKVTLVYAVLLAGLGVGFYVGTGSKYPTALIPLWFGLALGLFGFLAIRPSEKRRKIFMHVNVTIGAIGLLMAVIHAIMGYGRARSIGVEPNWIAIGDQLAMAGLLLAYVSMCVKSFIDARAARNAARNG